MIVLISTFVQLCIIVVALYATENVRKRTSLSFSEFVVTRPALFSSLVCFGSSSGSAYILLQVWFSIFEVHRNAFPLLITSMLLSMVSRGAGAQVYTNFGGELPLYYMKFMLIVQIAPFVWAASLHFLVVSNLQSAFLCLCLTTVVCWTSLVFSTPKFEWFSNRRRKTTAVFGAVSALELSSALIAYSLKDDPYHVIILNNKITILSGIIYVSALSARVDFQRGEVPIDLWDHFLAPALAKTVCYLVEAFISKQYTSLEIMSGLELYTLALLYGAAGIIGAVRCSGEDILVYCGIPTKTIYLQDDLVCGPVLRLIDSVSCLITSVLARCSFVGEFLEGVWESSVS